jgi:WD40 repeat protein
MAFFQPENTRKKNYIETKNVCQLEGSILAAQRNKDKLVVASNTYSLSQTGVHINHVAVTIIDLTACSALKKFDLGVHDNIHDFLFVNDNQFISACMGGNLKLWHIESGLIKTIKAHDAGITCLLRMGSSFISSSYNGEIKEWSLEGEFLGQYVGHTASVFSLVRLNEHTFASLSGNTDQRIIIWNNHKRTINRQIDVAAAGTSTRMVAINSELVATVGGSACLWDVERTTCLGQVQEPFFHSGSSALSKVSKNLLAVGTEDCIEFLSTQPFNLQPKLRLFLQGSSVTHRILAIDNGFISCNEDGKVRQHLFSEDLQEILAASNLQRPSLAS